MNRFCASVAVVLAGLSAISALAQTAPRRVMSINMCTDGLLLDLLPRERITSISFLSRSPSNMDVWPEAARVPVNYGSAEEILAQKPDLVLAAAYSQANLRALIRQFRIPVLEVPPATDFAGIRAVTRQVAAALGEAEKGEALIAKMDATLAELARQRPSRRLRVTGWNGGGDVSGPGSLFDAIVQAAGGVNMISEERSFGAFGLEELLLTRPDVLAYGSDSNVAPGRRADEVRHLLVMSLYKERRVVYPEVLYQCGVPQSAEAAKDLHANLMRIGRMP